LFTNSIDAAVTIYYASVQIVEVKETVKGQSTNLLWNNIKNWNISG